ncbi:MAG TPA: hypothetical protein VK966_00670, partial [Longimicrobiales bacterium]|nr:hypothetical protein [Longimicrobiales bacterium]
LDILSLDPGDAAPGDRPLPEGLVVYRDEGAQNTLIQDQAQTGKFLADAVSEDGLARHSGLFTLLEPGQDFFVHSSGLWLALRVPLRGDEALAVAYVTEAGDTVGDPAAERPHGTEKPELRLVRGPVTIHQPGQPTWDWEMHQVYRLDSSADVETSSMELSVSLGHLAGGATFRQYQGRQIPLLRLFGLDEDAPVDRVDAARIFRPGADADGFGASALRGTFVVFPTLEPFGTPPPVPTEGLDPGEVAAILGGDVNPVIYDAEDPVVRTSASRFRLNFRYSVRLDGVPSSFNLGAFGIRQGTERITVDNRLLVRGVDYVLDYDLGLVTLLDPVDVLGANPDAEIRATWEQTELFDVAPTTVFGLSSRSRLGEYGDLNLVGMYQSEQSIVRRPQLGTAPGAVMLGGASARLAFQADWLRRALDAIPILAVDSTARLDISGELATSAPEPNRSGATYLDDFEATSATPLSLDAMNWLLGSAPQDPTGVIGLPWPMDTTNAAGLVWQDRYLQGDREVGFLTANEIDEQIALAGAQLAERVLYMTMTPRPGTDGSPQWRSLTTVLSTTGRDLSRSEFLEFYTSAMSTAMEGATLIIDVGTVSEDAYYIAPDGRVEGTSQDGRPWGQGVLDEEARLALREIWGARADARGLWDQNCEAERLRAVNLGDPVANCTVNNGRPDTEDLNANGVLDDLDGPHFRYVVELDGSSPYLVRDRNATGTPFQLYRIPLRGPAAEAVGQAGDATWRFVKHIRVTVVKPNPGVGTLALARFRIAGSRWTKRQVDGVVSGPTGDAPGAGAGTTQFTVGSVSALTDGAAYASPPGVQDEVQDPKSAIGASGVEFNEKSLRLAWEGLPAGERAEVYYRYPQQPRSFLEYRSLRLWAVAREGSWGPGGDHRLQVKLGTDDRNYYLYQSPLEPATGGAVAESDWLPERVISFETWFDLKAEAERRLIEEGPPGGEPLVVWSADSTHAVVLDDRARAPNLAAVRELSFAVYNAGPSDGTGEVWLNDLRLDAGARGMGFAGRVDVDLDAGGVLAATASYGGRGGRFRQLDDFATYESSDELTAMVTAELGRFAPALGLSMPLTVSHYRTSLDPIFLQGTDVRADRLEGLREAGSSRSRVSLSIRKTTPSSNPLVSALVDGTSLRLGYVRARDGTVTTRSRVSGFDGGLDFDRPVARVDVGVMPEFLVSALQWLAPGRVESSEFFQRLTTARLRLTPARVGFSASYLGEDARVWRYERPLRGPVDDSVRALESPRRSLEGSARVTFQPFESLSVQGRLLSGRDLLEPARSTPLALQRQAIREARSELAGLPLGWERDRTVRTDVSFRPTIADWLRPSVDWNSRFGQRRD